MPQSCTADLSEPIKPNKAFQQNHLYLRCSGPRPTVRRSTPNCVLTWVYDSCTKFLVTGLFPPPPQSCLGNYKMHYEKGFLLRMCVEAHPRMFSRAYISHTR